MRWEQRIYTDQDEKVHPLILQLLQKGFTSVRIAYTPAPNNKTRGSFMMGSDQIKLMYLGYNADKAKTTIKKLENRK